MEIGSLIGDHYRVEGGLGRGGMAAVYRVVDERTGARVALKLMPPPSDPQHMQKLRAAFEREFYGLSQLKHPHIIAVHDCGLSEGLPYYTMELLDGQDLRELAPIPWKRACEVVRDVCSALAMLHSRRFVHRDISPRNVRCIGNGRAKLFDFGAMVPMGLVTQIVGTPPFMAPEVIGAQELDGRTDLYSVGVLLYWALTGTHPYPARAISQLRDLWRSPPSAPSARNEGIPGALDELVMSLIALDPMARPVNASVVMHALCAIAGLEAEEQLDVANAYLVTPTLVGRSNIQTQFRKRMLRVLQGHGGALMLAGEAGMGRSRMLASLALDAKLLGAIVMRVNASACHDEDKSVLSALVDALLELAPELAIKTAKPLAAALGIARPKLYARIEDAPPLVIIADVLERNARVQQAVAEWLMQLCSSRVLTIFVDDVQRCDPPSASLLSQLVQMVEDKRLFIVTSEVCDAPALASHAVSQLRERGSHETLKPLGRPDVDELLRSMFGDTPGLQAMGEWIHRLGHGNPRASMQLAQHLVDRGLAHYADGTWRLPDTLRGVELPQSFEQALEARLATLSPAACEIVSALALVGSLGALSLTDILQLFGEHMEPDAIHAALDELARSNIVNYAGNTVEVREAGIKHVGVRHCSAHQQLELHARLARIYLAGSRQRKLMAVRHLRTAGADDQAYDALVSALSVAGQAFLDVTLVRSSDDTSLIEWALRHAKSRSLPALALHGWRRLLLQMSTVIDPRLGKMYGGETLDQLRKDTGLIHYPQLDPALDPGTRLGMCFQRAQQAYEAANELERGFAVMTALRELALAAVMLSSSCALMWDCAGLLELEALFLPIRKLAPGLDLLYRSLYVSVETIVKGNSVLESRQELYAMLATPIEGLDEMSRMTTRRLHLFYVALEEAVAGDPNALIHTDELIGVPVYAALGWQARMMYHLYRGEAEQANACRQQKELLAASETNSNQHLILSMLFEAPTYARLGDLLGVARLLPQFDRMAELYPGWRPWASYTRGLYRSLRGELGSALRELESALSEAHPGEHNAWQHIIELYITTLARRGDGARALAAAHEARAAIERHSLRLGWPVLFEMAMASALHASGDLVAAREHAEHWLAVDTDANSGRGNIITGRIHELCSRLALADGDRPAALAHLKRMEEIFRPGRHPGLIASCERLLAELTLGDASAAAITPIAAPAAFVVGSTVATSARSWLMSLRDEQQRARDALELLIKSSHASGGHLFSVDEMQDVMLAASQAESAPEPGLGRWVADFAHELIQSWSNDTVTKSMSAEGTVAGYLQRVALTVPHDDDLRLVAVAVLCSKDGSALSVPADLLRAVADVLSVPVADGITVAAVAGG